jgi:hypothetical protein
MAAALTIVAKVSKGNHKCKIAPYSILFDAIAAIVATILDIASASILLAVMAQYLSAVLKEELINLELSIKHCTLVDRNLSFPRSLHFNFK